MILHSVVLVLVLSAHLVDFTDGQFNRDYFSGGGFPNVDWNYVLDIKADLQDGYFDYYDCTLKCFAVVFQLSYMNGDFCNGTFRLYSQDWSPVPFQKIVQVVECITVKCQTVVHKSVCDLIYDYPNDQYDPGSPLPAFNNPNYQNPAASDVPNSLNQLNSLISGTNPQAAAKNVPGSGADQLSQIGPQSDSRKKPSPGLKPQESSDSSFSTPFPLSDIMKQHLTKYGYKIPKSPSTSGNGVVAAGTVRDIPTIDTPTTDTTLSTTDSTTLSTTESTSTTETTPTTTESTTPTTPSTTESTTVLSTESTAATTASLTESMIKTLGSKTNVVDLLSDATSISSDNLNYPINSAGDNIRNPYYNAPYYRGPDYNGYSLGGPPGNYPYNSDNFYYYYFDYPYNDNYQQFPYNHRNPSYNPNLYNSKQVNIPGYQNQASGDQVGNLGYKNNQPALNYNSNGQSQNILTPFSANLLKNSQTPITQGIQGPDTNSILGNVQGVNRTPINQGAPGSSSFSVANSKSQINQAPTNVGFPNLNTFSLATSESQTKQAPNNAGVPGFGSFAIANSKSQINQAPTNVGVPNSNYFSFATSASQTNQASNNARVPGFGSFAFANSASQINGAPNNLGVPGSNSFSSVSQINQASNNLGGTPGLNLYNFANSGSEANTETADFGALGPNSYVNQQFRNQPLNNQGLQAYQVPKNFFRQQNMPQNKNSSNKIVQSSPLGANKNPANSEQNNKNAQNPIENLFKIEYNDETYVLQKNGSISVFKNGVFVRELSPFK